MICNPEPLTEATSPFFRPIKYSLFPPLGLATLAAYLGDDDDVTICDEHVEKLQLTSARRSKCCVRVPLAALAVVLGLTIWSQANVSSPPDAVLGTAIAVMVASGIVFTVATYVRAFRKIRLQTGGNDRLSARAEPSRVPSLFAVAIG